MIITNNITSLTNEHCEQIVNFILPIQQIEFNVPVTVDGQPDCWTLSANTTKAEATFGALLPTANLPVLLV